MCLCGFAVHRCVSRSPRLPPSVWHLLAHRLHFPTPTLTAGGRPTARRPGSHPPEAAAPAGWYGASRRGHHRRRLHGIRTRAPGCRRRRRHWPGSASFGAAAGSGGRGWHTAPGASRGPAGQPAWRKQTGAAAGGGPSRGAPAYNDCWPGLWRACISARLTSSALVGIFTHASTLPSPYRTSH